MIYTLGYSGWLPTHLEKTVTDLDAVLCDIRYSPASRNPQWSKKQLSALLGARYLHIQALGNVNYRNGGAIALADFPSGKQAVEPIRASGQQIILMCACRDVTTCHRLVAGQQLSMDWGEPMQHLSPTGAVIERQLPLP